MRVVVGMVIVLVSFASVASAQADETFHPSRVRLIFYGETELSDYVDLKSQFIPSGNLIGELSPWLFLGLGLEPSDWLKMEAHTGWVFGNDEPHVAVMLNPHFGDAWAWMEMALQLPSLESYWFAQVDYQILDWLHAGVEGEGWGSYEDASSWSQGGGPNILFRLGNFGLDLAVHARDVEGTVKPEFVVRTHVSL